MPQLLWDASALVKRYSGEIGSSTVDALFAAAVAPPMITTHLGYVETCAAQKRKLNQGRFDLTTFTKARSSLRLEVVRGPRFRLMTVDIQAIMAGVALIDQHSLNSVDAAILTTYLRYARAQPPGAPTCVLVASDQRLLRAAVAEGLCVVDPESVPAADVPALLASF